jgi:hypothetical protein
MAAIEVASEIGTSDSQTLSTSFSPSVRLSQSSRQLRSRRARSLLAGPPSGMLMVGEPSALNHQQQPISSNPSAVTHQQ